MTKKCMPEYLYHWSTAPVEKILDDNLQKANTQGRIYTLGTSNDVASTTKPIEAKSLIVYHKDALALFDKHPRWSFSGLPFLNSDALFKRFSFQSSFFNVSTQYVSNKFGDIEWDNDDVVHHGTVLLVSNARIIQIKSKKRRWWQFLKVAAKVVPEGVGTLAPLVIISIAVLFTIFYDPHFIDNPLLHNIWGFDNGYRKELKRFSSDIGFIPVLIAIMLFLIVGFIWAQKYVQKKSTRQDGWQADLDTVLKLYEKKFSPRSRQINGV